MRKVKLFSFLLGVVVCGTIVINMLIPLVRSQCVEIHARKDLFYGKLATELKINLQKRGYIFSCPNYLPKTVLDFTYTGSQYYQQKYPKHKKDINIALVGDCFNAFDIDFLKTYDYILVVSEMKFGYLAMFNFKAIHFPIKESFAGNLCHLDYDKQSINISNIANQLDDIIKRSRFDVR